MGERVVGPVPASFCLKNIQSLSSVLFIIFLQNNHNWFCLESMYLFSVIIIIIIIIAVIFLIIFIFTIFTFDFCQKRLSCA